ncbi:hypothetical protein [Aminobacter sp. AP02]|uniref:hypothetical protein n=1 Tax=Aminobacter sp. AP02 TaxID=2135737 RepID=UPI001304B3AD|nr:hypothetical protein [Aminobacter sp. AP02]
MFRTVSLSNLIGSFATAACALATVPDAVAAEQPVQAEKNPPGDIPDTQVFIASKSKDGYALKVPEGWARTDMPAGARFADKLDGVIVTLTDAGVPPTVASARSDYLPQLEKKERAVKIDAVKAVTLPAGKVIRIAYSSNSEPNQVTSKQIRLENLRFFYFRNGKLLALELYAPLVADNVDQWKLM